MTDSLDCGHHECREISQRLKVIADEQGEEAWERALFVLGYCAPPHDGESHDGSIPEDAMDYIDPKTMPHTARFVRQARQMAQEDARRALEEEQLDEIHREMKEERFISDRCIEEWEKLKAISRQRPLSDKEKRELEYAEDWFGGREKLLKYRTADNTPKGGYGGGAPRVHVDRKPKLQKAEMKPPVQVRRTEIKLWLRFVTANLAVALGLIMLIICGEYALRHNHDPDWVLVGFCGVSALYFMGWSIYIAVRQYEAMLAKYLR